VIFRPAHELGVVEPVLHLACLAGEWQLAVDQGLGEQDLTVVARALEQQGGTP
jgi:hypothetical protein